MLIFVVALIFKLIAMKLKWNRHKYCNALNFYIMLIVIHSLKSHCIGFYRCNSGYILDHLFWFCSHRQKPRIFLTLSPQWFFPSFFLQCVSDYLSIFCNLFVDVAAFPKFRTSFVWSVHFSSFLHSLSHTHKMHSNDVFGLVVLRFSLPFFCFARTASEFVDV